MEYQELQYKEEDDSEQSFILKSECPAVAVKEERHIIPFVSHSENEVDCLKNYKSIPRYRLNKQAKSSITQGLAAKKEQQPAIKEQQPAKKEQQPSFIARLEVPLYNSLQFGFVIFLFIFCGNFVYFIF